MDDTDIKDLYRIRRDGTLDHILWLVLKVLREEAPTGIAVTTEVVADSTVPMGSYRLVFHIPDLSPPPRLGAMLRGRLRMLLEALVLR